MRLTTGLGPFGVGTMVAGVLGVGLSVTGGEIRRKAKFGAFGFRRRGGGGLAERRD